MDERILFVAPSSLKKGFLKVEAWTIIITDKRLVFAKYSPEIIKKEAMERREEAKDQGRSKLGQFFAQASASFTWYKRYYDLPIEETLKEHSENYYLVPQDVINYQIKEGRTYRDEDDINKKNPNELILNTNKGKMIFATDADFKQLRDALNTLFHSL